MERMRLRSKRDLWTYYTYTHNILKENIIIKSTTTKSITLARVCHPQCDSANIFSCVPINAYPCFVHTILRPMLWVLPLFESLARQICIVTKKTIEQPLEKTTMYVYITWYANTKSVKLRKQSYISFFFLSFSFSILFSYGNYISFNIKKNMKAQQC